MMEITYDLYSNNKTLYDAEKCIIKATRSDLESMGNKLKIAVELSLKGHVLKNWGIPHFRGITTTDKSMALKAKDAKEIKSSRVKTTKARVIKPKNTTVKVVKYSYFKADKSVNFDL